MFNEPTGVEINGRERQSPRVNESELESCACWIMEPTRAWSSRRKKNVQGNLSVRGGTNGGGRGQRDESWSNCTDVNAGEGKRRRIQDENKQNRLKGKRKMVPLDRSSRFDKTFALDSFNGEEMGGRKRGPGARVWRGCFLCWRHFTAGWPLPGPRQDACWTV